MDTIEGTWRLVRAMARDDVGNPRPWPCEGQGMGRIVIGGGRMAVMMIDWRHDTPGDQKREYSGYTGSYTLRRKAACHHRRCGAGSAPDRNETASGGAVREWAHDPDPATAGSGRRDRTPGNRLGEDFGHLTGSVVHRSTVGDRTGRVSRDPKAMAWRMSLLTGRGRVESNPPWGGFPCWIQPGRMP
jgi:hypothetical protein